MYALVPTMKTECNGSHSYGFPSIKPLVGKSASQTFFSVRAVQPSSLRLV